MQPVKKSQLYVVYNFCSVIFCRNSNVLNIIITSKSHLFDKTKEKRRISLSLQYL